MKVTDYIAEFLVESGVEVVFGYQGSNIAHFVDSLSINGKIRYVQNYHEQASSFAACGYAKASGKLGVAISSSGPGAVNLIGGIADAYFDSAPCLFLTGQLNTNSLNDDPDIRQKGFQELDICALVSPVTKFCTRINDPQELPYYLEKAVFLANHMRKGPVLLDLPHNIQAAFIDPDAVNHFYGSDEHKSFLDQVPTILKKDTEEAVELICRSKRPLMLLGGGVQHIDKEVLSEFIRRAKLPFCTSMRGISAMESSNEYHLGMIGSYGERAANLAAAACDLLIVLGSRLDPHQMGGDPESFAKHAKIIHVDIDDHVLGYSKDEILSIHATCEAFLDAILRYPLVREDTGWVSQLIHLKDKYQEETCCSPLQTPVAFLRGATAGAPEGYAVCADVGQNLIWAARGSMTQKDSAFICSGGYGSMGFALPASFGAAEAQRKPVLCIVGDGGIQMNIQELGTLKKENYPVTVLIMKNDCLGMIRAYQEKVFKRYPGTIEGFTSPDYDMAARAYGLDFHQMTLRDGEVLKDVLNSGRPSVCVVDIDQSLNSAPEPAYRKPFYEQDPEKEEIETEYEKLLSIR